VTSKVSYLVPMPDGRLMDTRYRFKRKGSRATVDSRDGQMKGEYGLVSVPTYNVLFGENRWAQVQWDWVQKDYDGSAQSLDLT